MLQPSTPEELRDCMASAASARQTIELFGGNSKRLMAGPVATADCRVSTGRLRKILNYEPRDLTVSVEAGMPLAELNAALALNGQMVPLEGSFSDEATVGGTVAANISGGRRRLYGTARDLVIGMKFATLDGKLVDTGGMVVKNVAGLDMGKLMIGSFGTLAAIASVNFKLLPRPKVSRMVMLSFDDSKSALEARDAVLRGVLNPVAVELLNPVLAAQFSLKGFTLALLFGGNEAVIRRSLEAPVVREGRVLTLEEEQRFWQTLHGVTPRFLDKFKEGVVVRVSTTLAECGAALESVEGPGHAHAGSGVVRGWFTRPESASRWLAAAVKREWKGVIEFAAEAARPGLALWPEPGSDFAIMRKIKHMFDPEDLLNRGRLYGQL